MPTTFARRSFVAMLIVAAACGTSDPTSPPIGNAPVINPPVVTGPVYSPPKFPEPTGPARIYVFDRAVSYAVSSGTMGSRFVLYDDGAFALQYQGGEYRGGYKESDGTIVFDWEGWSLAGPWEATGTLSGDELTVHYNLIMWLTDFEDAIYVKGR